MHCIGVNVTTVNLLDGISIPGVEVNGTSIQVFFEQVTNENLGIKVAARAIFNSNCTILLLLIQCGCHRFTSLI